MINKEITAALARPHFSRLYALAIAATLTTGGTALAQLGYGVNANGILFNFDVQNPNPPVNVIGPVGFVPEGIDFRTGTGILYAIDIGPVTSQLYRINTLTATPTPIGPGFPSVGVNYDLVTPTVIPGTVPITIAQTFGFDFNPGSLQADGSIRIRLVSTSGQNLRINSDTGLIAAVDTPLAYPPGGPTPRVDGVAYINNNVPVIGGTTTLFDIDWANDVLATQNPPNAGTLNQLGLLGVSVDVLQNTGFDIYTDPLSVDTGIGGDSAYAVLKRTDTQGGAYLIYSVNLATGGVSGGALVGAFEDFTGGFAMTAIPETSTASAGLALIGGLGVFTWLRRRQSR